ncbi:uncharacterized protein LOC144517755 [Sander vitreus]
MRHAYWLTDADEIYSLLSHNSHEAESQDQKGGEDSGSTRNAEPEPNKRHHRSRGHSSNVNNPNLSEIHRDAHAKLPQPRVCKEEEVFADQQHLCIQERNSGLDQEEPEPPQIKEELCVSQEGEQLVLKQETDAFTLTPTYEESGHSEGQIAVEKNPPNYIWVKSSVVSEANSDHQLLSHNSHEAESQDQKGGEDSGLTRNAEPEPNKRHHRSRGHSSNVNNSNLSERHSITHTGKTSSKCDVCGKEFKYHSRLQRHMRTHTGERPYTCKTCGKDFNQMSTLKDHIRIHTNEPYTCKTCEKDFRRTSDLNVHMRTHTGERPYTCKTCGKDFGTSYELNVHMHENPHR